MKSSSHIPFPLLSPGMAEARTPLPCPLITAMTPPMPIYCIIPIPHQ